MKPEDIINRFGRSEHDNFGCIDTIRVPHPYVIGAGHVSHASDYFGGILGEAAIESGEKAGIKCQHRGCRLSFSEHGNALLVECLKEPTNEDKEEIETYLKKVVDLLKPEDKIVGFTLLKRWE